MDWKRATFQWPPISESDDSTHEHRRGIREIGNSKQADPAFVSVNLS